MRTNELKICKQERPMNKHMKEELKRINRRIEKAKRRLAKNKYYDSESEIIDRLTLRKIELLEER